MFSDFGVVHDLGTQPVPVGKAEETAQPQVGIGRNGTFARHDVADALRGHADLLCQTILADPHGLQKLFQQEFTGCYQFELAHLSSPSAAFAGQWPFSV